METLTLEQAYYLGEMIAAVVVIISLLYLALQVRASNQASLIDSVSAYSPRYDRCFEFLTVPENARLYLAATQGYENLDEAQKLRFRSFFTQLMNVLEDGYLISEEVGIYISPGRERKLLFHDILKSPGGRSAWKEIQHLVDAVFRDIVNKVADSKGEIPLYM